MIASEMSPVSAANNASATASGLMARPVAVTAVELPAKTTPLSFCTVGYRLASAWAAASNAAGFAPGRSRTSACAR